MTDRNLFNKRLVKFTAIGLIGLVAGFGAYNVYQDRMASEIASPPPAVPEEGCTDQIVLLTIRDLRNNPDNWENDGYTLETGGGWFERPYVGIWIANEAYGLDFRQKSGQFRRASVDYAMTDQCRSLLWNTVNNWKVNDFRNGLGL